MSDVTDSEVQGATGDQVEATAGKSKKKLLIIGGVALVALLGAAGAGAWFLTSSGVSPAGGSVAAVDVREPIFFDLPVMTVNLNNAGASPEFLKLSVSIEVRDPSMMAIIEPRLPRVLDTFQVYLRELRRADLEGSAGIYRLKEELHRRINLAVYPASVDNILFKEILVQ